MEILDRILPSVVWLDGVRDNTNWVIVQSKVQILSGRIRLKTASEVTEPWHNQTQKVKQFKLSKLAQEAKQMNYKIIFKGNSNTK